MHNILVFLLVSDMLFLLYFNLITSSRENKTKILEFLRNSWANDRRTEWSIWMVYSKVEMPHQYMSNGVEGTSLFHGLRGRSLSTRRLTDDVIILYTLYTTHKLHYLSAEFEINH